MQTAPIASCPVCNDVSVIKRATRAYCANCGWTPERGQILVIKDPEDFKANEEASQAIDRASVKPPEEVEEGIRVLATIISQFEDLSERFNFEIPQKMRDFLKAARDIIAARAKP